MRILFTGGAGFIGHHVVDHFLKNTDAEIIILDRLNYASAGLDRLRDSQAYDSNRVLVLSIDLSQPISDGVSREIGQVDYILHLAAETHVDNSIGDPRPFIMSNVVGTLNLLEWSRSQLNLKKFIYLSTDEVFGPAQPGQNFKEWDRYNSSSPYSASKAGGEELCLAYASTFGLPIIVLHTMNAFGERQHPEKFMVKVIRALLQNDIVYLHADLSTGLIGIRSWIHCRNIASAIQFLMEKGESREKYNVVGEKELTNLELAYQIAEIVGKPLNYKLVDYRKFRPGFDPRYSLCGEKMKSMGWSIPIGFETALSHTVKWTLDNPKWLRHRNYQEASIIV